MKRRYPLLLIALVALFLPALQAWASLSDYNFQVTYGNPIEGETTELLHWDAYNKSSDVADIGFTFYLDGTPYTTFSVSSNGLIGLGSTPVTACWENSLGIENGGCGGYDLSAPYTLEKTPQIAPFWEYMQMTPDGGISYAIVGEAPNRILVINFRGFLADITGYGYYDPSSWQARLYEGSNKIEFFYDYMSPLHFSPLWGTGGSVGIAVSASNLISISGYFDFNTYRPEFSLNSNYANDNFSLQDQNFSTYQMLPYGTMFVFNPCSIQLVRDPEQGGGDGIGALLLDKSIMFGTSAEYRPFGLSLDGECNSHSYTMKLSGPNAGDYSIDAPQGEVFAGDKPVTPVITFSPTGVGTRLATLTITDELNRSISVLLAAVGTSRIVYVPDMDQGGSPQMKNRDTLMYDIMVHRNESGEFTPFTLTNISQIVDAPPADVTYSIVGISGGQYSIDRSSASLNAAESSTPVITFSPTGVGRTVDTLIVTAEGEVRKFVLMAFSNAVGAYLYTENRPLGSGAALFPGASTCISGEGLTVPIEVENIGRGSFDITGLDVYAIDTTKLTQSPYALGRDADGQFVRMTDYIITDRPYVPGMTVSYPISVPEGATQTLYFTFIGSQPGRRFARVFINTNGENFSGLNVEGDETLGLLSFDVYGQGLSSRFSGSSDGSVPKPLVFPPTGIGQTNQLSLPIYNAGLCTLRIDTRKLMIASGDVTEFKIVELPPADKLDPISGEIVLAPGENTSIMVSFTPSQIGSRRASIVFVTNDPNAVVTGVTVPGTYTIDLYGVGGSGLYTEATEFDAAVIGGSIADYSHGEVRVINNDNIATQISQIEIIGDDAADFLVDGSWPTPPVAVTAGQRLHLGVAFAPMGGTSGMRQAQLRIVTADGQTLLTDLRAFAGTRVLVVDRDEMNFIGTTARGSRQTLVISNVGTMALKLNDVVLAGSESSGFALGDLPRLEFAPGQSEQLEISYNPSSAGASNATLTLTSNVPGSGSIVIVKLNGQAQQSQGLGEDPSESAMGGDRYGDGSAVVDEGLRLSGVEGEVMVSGMALRQSVPNPGRDEVTISYVLRNGGEVSLVLYDGVGSLVKVLDAGVRESGEYVVGLDVHGLSSGVYHYRLSVGGKVLDRSLRVVH